MLKTFKESFKSKEVSPGPWGLREGSASPCITDTLQVVEFCNQSQLRLVLINRHLSHGIFRAEVKRHLHLRTRCHHHCRNCWGRLWGRILHSSPAFLVLSSPSPMPFLGSKFRKENDQLPFPQSCSSYTFIFLLWSMDLNAGDTFFPHLPASNATTYLTPLLIFESQHCHVRDHFWDVLVKS